MGKKDSTNSLRRRQALALRPSILCTVAFICHWGWQHIVLYAPLFSTNPSDTALWFSNNLLALFLSIIVLVVAPTLERWFGKVRTTHIFAAIVIFEVLGTVACIVPVALLSYVGALDSSLVYYSVETSAKVFISIGTELFGILLIRTLSEFSDEDREKIVGVATIAGFIVYVFVSSLIDGLQYALVLSLPICLAISLSHVKIKSDGRVPPVKQPKIQWAGLPLGLLLSLCAMASTINFMRGISSGNGYETSDSVVPVFSSITLLAGLILFGSYMIFKRFDVNVKPLLVAILVLGGYFWTLLSATSTSITHVLTFAAFFVYVTILYRVIARHVNAQRPGWCRTTALGLAFNAIGLTLGSTLSRLINPAPDDLLQYAVIGLVLVCGLLEAAFYLSRFEKPIKTRKHTSANMSEEASTGVASHNSANTDACEKISTAISLTNVVELDSLILAEAYGLTARERDVLILLVRGRSLQGVSDDLHISVNTAKSHIAHVYKKLEVHTREDLFALLDQADAQRTELAE